MKKILVMVLLAAGCGAVAKDWPEYCGTPCKNLVAEARNLPDSFSPGEKDSMKGVIVPGSGSNVLWGVRTSSLTYPSPTIVGDRIFTGCREAGLGVFKCLDARTGRTLWQYAEPFRKFPEKIDGDWKYMLGRITSGPLTLISSGADQCSRSLLRSVHSRAVLFPYISPLGRG